MGQVEDLVAKQRNAINTMSNIGRTVRASLQLKEQAHAIIKTRLTMLKSIDDRIRRGIFDPEADLRDLEDYLRNSIGRSSQNTVANLERLLKMDNTLQRMSDELTKLRAAQANTELEQKDLKAKLEAISRRHSMNIDPIKAPTTRKLMEESMRPRALKQTCLAITLIIAIAVCLSAPSLAQTPSPSPSPAPTTGTGRMTFSDNLKNIAESAVKLAPAIKTELEGPLLLWLERISLTLAGLIMIAAFAKMWRENAGAGVDLFWWFARLGMIFALLGSGPKIINGMGYQFLARSRFAGYENRYIVSGGEQNFLFDLPHWLGIAYQEMVGLRCVKMRAVLLVPAFSGPDVRNCHKRVRTYSPPPIAGLGASFTSKRPAPVAKR